MTKEITTRAVILAAGKGTRMQSDLPKVLHPVAEKPMVAHAIAAAQQGTGSKPILVVGHRAEDVMNAVGDTADFVMQNERLGTGHAVQQAQSALQGKTDQVVVCYGDMPLLKSETIEKLVAAQSDSDGQITMLTVIAPNPRGFGRIIRGEDNTVLAIVEEVDATEEQLLINELNVGVYCMSSDWLWENLSNIHLSPKGEYYLTDLVGIAVSQGHPVQAIIAEDIQEVIGVNTSQHLAEAEKAMLLREKSEKEN